MKIKRFFWCGINTEVGSDDRQFNQSGRCCKTFSSSSASRGLPHIRQAVRAHSWEQLGGEATVEGFRRSLVSRRMEGSRVSLYLHRLWVSNVKVLVCPLLRSMLGVLGHRARPLLRRLQHH